MFVADYHSLQQLQDLARAILQKRLWRRVQAVVLTKQGRTAEDIARAMGLSRPTIYSVLERAAS